MDAGSSEVMSQDVRSASEAYVRKEANGEDESGVNSNTALTKDYAISPSFKAQKTLFGRALRAIFGELVGRSITRWLVSKDWFLDKEKTNGRRVINPACSPYVMWYTFTVTLVLWVVVTLPAVLAFGPIDRGSPNAYNSFALVIDCVFFVDVIVTFKTGYFDYEGRVVGNQRKIARRYLASTFVFDILASFPFQLVVTGKVEGVNAPVLQLTSLFRLFRIPRALKAVNSLDRDFRVPYTPLSLVKLTAVLLIANHWWGCGFYYVARLHRFQENTWVYQFDPQLPSRPLGERLVASWYWSVTTGSTVGYGDIHPTNVGERCFAMAAMLINLVIFGFAVANLTSIITRKDAETAEQRAKLSDLDDFLVLRNVNNDTREEAVRHLQRSFDAAKESDIHLDNLTRHMRERIRRGLYKESLEKSHLFRGTSDRLIEDVLAAVEREVYFDRSLLTMQGTAAAQFGIIIEGRALVVHDNELEREIEEQATVGEEASLFQLHYKYTCISNGVCKLLVLQTSDWNGIAGRHPSDAEKVKRNSIQRIREGIQQARTSVPSGNPALELLREVNEKRAADASVLADQVFDAASAGDDSKIFSLVNDFGASPDSPNPFGRTAAHAAATSGHSHVIRTLTNVGAEIDRQDSRGITPLAEAVHQNQSGAAATLASLGASLATRDSRGDSPLRVAAKSANVGLCRALRENSQSNEKETFHAEELNRAVERCDTRYVQALLECDAHVDAGDYACVTALHVAVWEQNLPMARMLVRQGASGNVADKHGITQLELARRSGSKEVYQSIRDGLG